MYLANITKRNMQRERKKEKEEREWGHQNNSLSSFSSFLSLACFIFAHSSLLYSLTIKQFVLTSRVPTPHFGGISMQEVVVCCYVG